MLATPGGQPEKDWDDRAVAAGVDVASIEIDVRTGNIVISTPPRLKRADFRLRQMEGSSPTSRASTSSRNSKQSA